MSVRVEAMKRLLEKGADEIERRKSGEVRIVWRGRSHLKLHVSEEIASEPPPGTDAPPGPAELDDQGADVELVEARS